jgi:hypothetical protein
VSQRLDQAAGSAGGAVAAFGPPVSFAGLLALALSLVHAPAARAAEARTAFLPLQGPAAEQVEKILVQVFPPELGLLPLAQVDRALTQAGAVLPVTVAQHAALGRKLKATAIVGGRIFSSAGGWRLRLVARDGTTGAALGSMDFDGRNRFQLAVNVRRQAPASLRNALSQAPASAQEAPEPVASEPMSLQPAVLVEPTPTKPKLTPRPPESDSDGGEGAGAGDRASADEEDPPAKKRAARKKADDADAEVAAGPETDRVPEALLELSIGPRVMSRAFIYTDNVAGLPGYTLPAALGAFAEAEVYPGARTSSAARNFGLAGMWEASMGAKTIGRDGSGTNLTRGKSYRAGIRFRLKSGNSALTLGGDYGEHSFDLTVDNAIPPNVVYNLFRPSVAARMALGPISLGVTAAYLHVLSVGGLGDKDRFPRIRAKGAEVGVLAGYALDRDFELRLLADLRHYAHDMHVKPGDPFIVGGAVDEHFGATMVINYRLR